jgi:stage II sporulation protein P
VGSEIAKKLQNTYGIGTIQIKTIHDLPDYNMAYTNALKTITSTLNKYPSIKVVIDIHRDGIAGDMPFNTTTTVNGKKAARVMPVIGTSASGLPHPFWKDNAIFGIKFAFEINKIAPGLSRPVYISEYRYNQHISKGSIIIEVGGDGNSISEAVVSASYIADAIAAVIK